MPHVRETILDNVGEQKGKTVLFGKLPFYLGLAVVLLLPPAAYALNPSHEKEFHSSVVKLTQNVARLNDHFSGAFQPGNTKETGGPEEIAWRMRDLNEKTQKLATLSQDYWKNETGVLGILDQWHQDATLIDEAMIYSPVSQEISDAWRGTKELGMQVRDFVEEMPSQGEWERVGKEFAFEIVKVGRYVKKQILREKVKEFIGGSELDKWPFVDERQDLRPGEIGEHFLVRFKLRPSQGGVLDLPLKLRFEYKFALHQHDGFQSVTYQQLKGGTYDFLFKNMGKDYKTRGKIIHWRASLLLNEKVVAQKQSTMWRVVSEWAPK